MGDLRPRGRPALCRTIALAIGLLAPLTAVAADAEGSDHDIGGARVDVHADMGGYASLGAGLHVDVPLLREGLLAAADDEIAISPGVDVFFANFYQEYYSGGPYVIPSLVAQWNFYLRSAWSVFPEAGVAFYIGDADELLRELPVYAALDVGVGARYHFTSRNALLLRLSTPTGLQVGMTF